MSDRRRLFANDRVAHSSLRGEISAPRYSDGEHRIVAAPVADIYRTADSTALERQMVRGEAFVVLEETGARSFGRAGENGYVGYVPTAQLAPWHMPNRRVTVPRSFAFAAPDIKTPAPVPLSMASRVSVVREVDRFGETRDGLFIPLCHLKPLDHFENDPVAVAERLIGTPYLWGGNSGFGIDCSGLVQIARTLCGLPCPGDSDQQLADLGAPLSASTPPRRGDLLFWKGHVAWVADADTLIHANAGHMAVASEPLLTAIARINAQGDGPVIAHVRPGDQIKKASERG